MIVYIYIFCNGGNNKNNNNRERDEIQTNKTNKQKDSVVWHKLYQELLTYLLTCTQYAYAWDEKNEEGRSKKKHPRPTKDSKNK